jgi:hypothetical protein
MDDLLALTTGKNNRRPTRHGGKEMTRQQRLTIRAELARRMGIPENEWLTVCFACHHDISDDAWCRQCNADAHETEAIPPNPFTNAEDKDALVEWLAADHTRWERFDDALFAIYDMWKGAGRDAQIRNAMTAPLEVIVLAACKALGIGEA